MIREDVDRRERAIEFAEAKIVRNRFMIEILSEYEYSADVQAMLTDAIRRLPRWGGPL